MSAIKYYKQRTEKFMKIAEFLVSNCGCEIQQKKLNTKKTDDPVVLPYIILSPQLADIFEISCCYVYELNFDIDLIRLWALVETFETLGYSLVVYPTYCYWIDENGDQASDDFSGEKRIGFLFDACVDFIEQYNNQN